MFTSVQCPRGSGDDQIGIVTNPFGRQPRKLGNFQRSGHGEGFNVRASSARSLFLLTINLYDFYFDRNELGQDVWTEWLKLDVCRYKFKEQYLYKNVE